MRHNADWQLHNYPSLGRTGGKRGGPQCRVILLKCGIAPEFAGMAGLCRSVQVSKSPTPLFEACAHSRRLAPLPKVPTRRTELVTLYLHLFLCSP